MAAPGPISRRSAVDADFAQRLGSTLDSIEVSQTAAEPLPAFEAIQQLLGENAGERRIVYLLSDFRTRQWDKPDDLKKRLAQLDDEPRRDPPDRLRGRSRPAEPGDRLAGAGGRHSRRGRAVADAGHRAELRPVRGSQGAGLLVGRRQTGRNGYHRRIPPGRAAQKEFYVNFAVAGEHLIEAHLNADAVNADNHRYAVVDLPVATPVLLVDGHRAAGNAKRIGDALTARKGIQPEIVSADYLSAPKRPLGDFAMICVTQLRQDRALRASRPWRNMSRRAAACSSPPDH